MPPTPGGHWSQMIETRQPRGHRTIARTGGARASRRSRAPTRACPRSASRSSAATACSARSCTGELRARERLRRVRGAAAQHRRREHGRGAGERAPLRRDAAPAQGNRAARRRAGGHQQHPGGAGRRARLPGDRRSGRRQAARDLRDADDVGIRWYDPQDQSRSTICTSTSTASGCHIDLDADSARADRAQRCRRRASRCHLRIDRAQTSRLGDRYRAPTWPKSIDRASRSSAATACSAMITLDDHERENAFGDVGRAPAQHRRSSMGVALENARLFDETQRLFKETEQRAAELAIINSVQQGLAAELDIQGDLRSRRRQDPRDLRHGGHVASRSTTRQPT